MSTSAEFAPWLGLFETLRVIDGKPLFFAEHRAELVVAMQVLGLTSNTDFAAEGGTLPMKSGRWRWIVTRSETITLFSEEPAPLVEPVALSVSPVRIGSANWDARFKTLSYLSHVQASKIAETPEVILLNEHGHVASAAHANLFWRRGEQLFTPAHEAGCRRGVVREVVLKQRKTEVGHFPLTEILAADEIFITNSMRGIVSIKAVEGRSLDSFPAADALREIYAHDVALRLQNRLPFEHW